MFTDTDANGHLKITYMDHKRMNRIKVTPIMRETLVSMLSNPAVKDKTAKFQTILDLSTMLEKWPNIFSDIEEDVARNNLHDFSTMLVTISSRLEMLKEQKKLSVDFEMRILLYTAIAVNQNEIREPLKAVWLQWHHSALNKFKLCKK